MRILHINCNYIGTTLHQLMIEKLDTLGVENEVFVPTYDRNTAVIKPNDNVYVSECFSKWNRVLFDLKQYKIIKAVEEHYDITSFDLIHAYTLFTDGNVARKLSEKYGIPYVVAVRNTDVNVFFKKMLYLRKRGERVLLQAKHVFFLSKTYQKTVLERYISKTNIVNVERKSVMIPNGIDNFWFENKFVDKNIDRIVDRLRKKQLRIIYVGGIDKNKNISTTCRAIDILRAQGWSVSFLIVGKIKDNSVYNAIKDYVDYYTPRQKEELLELYRQSDIFVMPSYTETFGLVYAEAMSQGLPVIYSRGQGFDGQFCDGLVGYSVDANDSGELARKVLECVDHYCELSGNAERLVSKFDWEKICQEYKTVYKAR